MMKAAEARDELRSVQYAMARLLKEVRALEEVAQSVKDRVDRPMPGAIVKHHSNGRLYRVVRQNGTLRMDTMGDAGLVDCGEWQNYDIVQDGAADQPWPKE